MSIYSHKSLKPILNYRSLTFNGIGTRYYGRRKLSDGTIITTKWVVFLFVPIVPLGSYKVIGEGDHASVGIPFFGLAYFSSRRLKLQEIDIDTRMVITTYLIAFVIVGVFVAAIYSTNTPR
jgi:hypothetical protein